LARGARTGVPSTLMKIEFTRSQLRRQRWAGPGWLPAWQASWRSRSCGEGRGWSETGSGRAWWADGDHPGDTAPSHDRARNTRGRFGAGPRAPAERIARRWLAEVVSEVGVVVMTVSAGWWWWLGRVFRRGSLSGRRSLGCGRWWCRQVGPRAGFCPRALGQRARCRTRRRL